MSKELVCPFCNKKLEPIGTSGQFQCGTWGCDASFTFIATRDVWEYIDRTRKALDVAVDALKEYEDRDSYDCNGDWCGCEYSTAHKALEQITALEQKESAFAHNKIEFPEYNDGLLEEFDKHFFENGQDDDLTETALEQKDVK